MAQATGKKKGRRENHPAEKFERKFALRVTDPRQQHCPHICTEVWYFQMIQHRNVVHFIEILVLTLAKHRKETEVEDKSATRLVSYSKREPQHEASE